MSDLQEPLNKFTDKAPANLDVRLIGKASKVHRNLYILTLNVKKIMTTKVNCLVQKGKTPWQFILNQSIIHPDYFIAIDTDIKPKSKAKNAEFFLGASIQILMIILF